jgi:hypothetical protein
MSGPRDLAEAEQLADQLAEESRYAGGPRYAGDVEDADDCGCDDCTAADWCDGDCDGCDECERPIVNVPGGDLL